MVKLHLCCGKRRIDGYLNIDIQETNATDIVCDVTKELPFESDSIDLIYCCAAIEHFSRHEWKNVLRYWKSLLKQDGRIILSTADFEACCEEYKNNKDIDSLIGLLNGGQKDSYDRHGMIFDFNYLKKALEEIGFKDIKRYEWQDMEFYQNKDFDDYSSAYLPHGSKPNGRLMMLNMEAKK